MDNGIEETDFSFGLPGTDIFCPKVIFHNKKPQTSKSKNFFITEGLMIKKGEEIRGNEYNLFLHEHKNRTTFSQRSHCGIECEISPIRQYTEPDWNEGLRIHIFRKNNMMAVQNGFEILKAISL